MIRKCLDCRSEDLFHDSYLGEIICNNCGLVLDEKMVDFNPNEMKSKIIKKNSKERITQKSFYEKSIEKKIFENTKKSKEMGEFLDGKKLLKRFALIRTTFQDLNLINKEEIKKNCKEYYRTIVEKKLAKGKSHQIIIYSLIMCLLSDFARKSIQENNERLNELIEDWGDYFEINYPEEFSSADRMFRKVAKDCCEEKGNYSLKSPAIHLFDNVQIKLKDKDNFSLFMYNEYFKNLNEDKKKILRNLLNRSNQISAIFLRSKEGSIKKMNGLVGTTIYFILNAGEHCPEDCKNKSLIKKSQKEWANFLEIGLRSFKRILSNLRSCNIDETKYMPKKYFEGKIEVFKGIPLYIQKE